MQKAGVESSLRHFMQSMVSVVLKIMLFIAVAGMFGIETTSFIAIL
jgi:small conductance mechanosensitive channel